MGKRSGEWPGAGPQTEHTFLGTGDIQSPNRDKFLGTGEISGPF